MPSAVGLIQHMDNRHISQLTLRFPGDVRSVGGGVRRNDAHNDDTATPFFDTLCSVEHLFASWERFRRGKGSKDDVQAFERHLERNLFDLHDVLRTRTYRHGSYHAFTIHDPKERQIHKATVRDRVVHQAVVDIIEPLFDGSFIDDSFSCRVGKGTHAGVRRLQAFLLHASKYHTRTVHVLQCDIEKFFASVDHNMLLTLLQRRVTEPPLRQLLAEIIRSSGAREGISLGNLTSQLCANVYLHELDRFVKHELRERWYLRYCDDFATVHPSREHLICLVPRIGVFLTQALRLRLHPRKVTIRTWRQGIDFLGYVLLPHATVLRTRTQRRMLRRLSPMNACSYFGYCTHAATYDVQQVMRTKIGMVVKQ